MNALGVYLLASLLFVIGSMLEFAIIMFLHRRHDLGQDKKVADKNDYKRREDSIDIKTLSAKIDGIALILFLSGYVLFNAVYWKMFSNTTQENEETYQES